MSTTSPSRHTLVSILFFISLTYISNITWTMKHLQCTRQYVLYAGLCAIYWSNSWLLIFGEEAQLQREPTWTACSWSSVWKSKRRWDLKIGVEALTQPNAMKSGSRPTFLKSGGDPNQSLCKWDLVAWSCTQGSRRAGGPPVCPVHRSVSVW